jgi:hypothetical protein
MARSMQTSMSCLRRGNHFSKNTQILIPLGLRAGRLARKSAKIPSIVTRVEMEYFVYNAASGDLSMTFEAASKLSTTCCGSWPIRTYAA